MIRSLFILLAIYAAFVLEATGTASDSSGVEPRWLLLAAAGMLWTQRLPIAVLAAAMCGLLMDVLADGPACINISVVSLLAWALAWLRRDRRWSSDAAGLLLTFLLTAGCVEAGRATSLMLSGQSGVPARDAALSACGQGAMTALCAAGIGALWRLGRRVVPRLARRRAG